MVDLVVQKYQLTSRCQRASWGDVSCFSSSLIRCLMPRSRLYVGSLHFNLTESDIKQVFEVFGELEFVDLHRDAMTGRSKGYAFIQ